MIGCEQCPFGNRAKRVPGKLYGAGGCDLMIVGEAPGEQEIRKGEPFVGPSGALLWKALGKAHLDITTSDYKVSTTNALCCRPPGSVKVTNEAIYACRSRLMEEIEAEQPKILLALGNTALRSITGDMGRKITDWQGSVIEIPSSNGADILVVPAIHPAAVLRRAGDYHHFASAIRYAVSLLHGAPRKCPGDTAYRIVREHMLCEVVGALIRRADEAIQADPPAQLLFGADIETTGLDPLTDRIIALGLCWSEGKVLIFPRLQINSAIMLRLFEHPGVRWIWHNGKFDVSFLRNIQVRARVDEDVMLMHYTLNETTGTHDLGQISSELLGAGDYKGTFKAYLKSHGLSNYGEAPRRLLYPYLAKDADYTLKIYHSLRNQLDQPSNDGLLQLYHQTLMPASEELRKIERRGIYVDEEENIALHVRLQAEKEEALHEAWRQAELAIGEPLEFNPGSWQQVADLLYRRMNLKVPKGYQPDTREATLKVLPKNDVVKSILRYREVAKADGTYVVGIANRMGYDNRVRSTYLIHGTVTGRLSSRNPNLQNVTRPPDEPKPGEEAKRQPPNLRNQFQAPPGRMLVELDYNQAELRVLAILSGDPVLQQIYREGRNIHKEMALRLYGPNYNSEEYIRTKAANFGIIYGRTMHSFVKEYGMTPRAAQKLIDDWFALLPVAKQFLDSCRMAPRQGRTLISPFGRRRRFGLVTADNIEELQNEASNFPIQSTASDLTLHSAIRLDDLLETGYDSLIINLVHDSILIETPDDPTTIIQVISRGKEVMRQVGIDFLGDAVLFESEAKVGRKWGDLRKEEEWQASLSS